MPRKVRYLRNIPDAEMADFTIALFRTHNLPVDRLIDWKNTSSLFVLESCARQSWLGCSADFESMPLSEQDRENIVFYKGAEAYGYMLKLLSGLDGKTPGDNQEVGRINREFALFQAAHPEKAKTLQKIIEAMRSDVRVVREATSNHMMSPRSGRAAVHCADTHMHLPVMLITTLTGAGDLDNNARDILQIVGKTKGHHSAEKIVVSTPNDEKKKELMWKIAELQKEGRIECPVTYVPWADLIDKGFYKASDRLAATYVTCKTEGPLGAQLLHGYAQQLNPQTSPLVMLRGGGERNQSSEFWKQAAVKEDIYKIILPENVREEELAMKLTNARLGKEGARMIINCVHARMDGKRPVTKELKSATYCHVTGTNDSGLDSIDLLGVAAGEAAKRPPVETKKEKGRGL